MSQSQLQQLYDKNVQWNASSVFNVNFLGTGSFFEVSNTSGKVHDISFQCILQSLKDIQSSDKAKQFINYTVQKSTPIRNDLNADQQTFDSISPIGHIQCTEWKYFEKMVRVLGLNVFTHPRAKVAAQEQSKLFFNVVSRFIHIATNKIPQELDERTSFSEQDILTTIDYLEQVISDCTIFTFRPLTSTTITSSVISKRIKNTIYLGAPGTGKSYSIEQLTAESQKFRTVFHPDTQYSDLVGSLKPRMRSNGSSQTISYEFRPGAFTNAFIQAKNNPNQRVFLIIEEINRAPAAAVFGDLFQLLDPDCNYEIDIDPDMLDYINNHLTQSIDKLSLPVNLTILATMNSSDQGVNFLDTAFKRRWAIRYIPIDYSKATPGVLYLPLQGDIYQVEWSDFSKIINERLTVLGIPEDRLLGHRFLSLGDLSDSSSANDSLRYKLFVYLWDDILRHGKRSSIFATEVGGISIVSFGQLVTAFSEGKSVFESSLEEALISVGAIQPKEVE
ncbi:AAA family ATPase [Citrobacter sp. wls827]|uniref:McrB family protein n=1 Tax=Citrobacter sp. wls827 TaxID=2576414 RepID=UPI002016B0DD|nr:AAA family ATPase [Citrobacter sp. wls827]